jgi:hypothetical protein
MTTPQEIDLAPTEAARRIQKELERASDDLRTDDFGSAFDGYVRALGLALQLGPALSERVLVAVLDAAQELASRKHAEGLSTLGPAMIDLVAQVRAAGALPPTSVMEAWATIASELGALIGQIGLALAMPSDHREGMVENARTRAALLDDATRELFALTHWLDQLDADLNQT